jgi:hypothetical protein
MIGNGLCGAGEKMGYLIVVEILGYFGILLLQGIWYRRGELTENRFAIMQTAFFSLFFLSTLLAISTTLMVTTLGVVLSLVCWVFFYPFARWLYREMLAK